MWVDSQFIKFVLIIYEVVFYKIILQLYESSVIKYFIFIFLDNNMASNMWFRGFFKIYLWLYVRPSFDFCSASPEELLNQLNNTC